MTKHMLFEAYVLFCIAFVTGAIALCFGAYIFGFTQQLVKELKYWRQTRRNGQRLQEEIGRIDEVLEDEHGVSAVGRLHASQADFYNNIIRIPPRTTREYKPHFEVLADGTVIENFPKGVPEVDNRNPKR